jgi:hypothetical protein
MTTFLKLLAFMNPVRMIAYSPGCKTLGYPINIRVSSIGATDYKELNLS